MSSTTWACLILSPATLHLVSGTTWCHYITRPVAVPDRGAMMLSPGCRSAMLARPCNLPGHTSHRHLMDRLLHAMQTRGAALGNMRA
jgi:hypothetical protein